MKKNLVFLSCLFGLLSISNSTFANTIGLKAWGGVEFAHSGMTDWWQTYNNEEYNQLSYSSPLTGIKQNSWGDRAGVSEAKADFGTLGVYSYTTVASKRSGSAFWVNANANAAFSDVWNVAATGLDGTTGTLTVSVALTGSRTLNGDDHYSSLTATFGDETTNSSENTNHASFNYTNITAGNYSLTVSFRYGVDNDIYMNLESANAASNSPGPGVVSYVDFLHTAKITGLSFYDAAGKKITDYAMTTGSSHDYIADAVPSPIPEPSTVLLFSSGLLTLLGLGAKRTGNQNKKE